MKRWIVPLVAALLIGGGLETYRRYGVATEDLGRIRELRSRHQMLQARLESLASDVPLLSRSEVDAGDVVVALRTPYVGDLIREVSRRYLDRVDISLGDIHVREAGELKKDTFFGNVKLGDWTVNLDVARLSGTLGGHAPDLQVAPGNTVKIAMPVSVLSGRGQGILQFRWSAHSVVNVVCHDFSVQETLDATVVPDTYRVRGAFSIAAQGDEIVAKPRFPRDKFRVRVDLTPESWAKVRAALDAQDTPGRCGIAMNPEDVVKQLRELGHNGFDVRLPPSLFRPVVLPAGMHSEVEVEGTKVAVDVKARLLQLTPEVLWYGASIHARILSAPPRPTP